LGTALVAGRDFTWTDIYEKRPVVIITENMAREYWGGPAAALGKQIRSSPKDDWAEIVGVIAAVHDQGVSQEAPSAVNWPILMRHFWDEEPMVRRDLAFIIRSRRTSSESFMKEVRQAVWSVNANLPLADVRSLDYFYQKSMARTSFTLVMLGVAGAMALLLGIVGLYGVIAYSVSQRTKEIGIRRALGAKQEELTEMFVGQGLLLTGVGVACGLGTALLLMRLMASLLFKVRPIDPPTYVVASIGLIATAVVASYLPSSARGSSGPRRGPTSRVGSTFLWQRNEQCGRLSEHRRPVIPEQNVLSYSRAGEASLRGDLHRDSPLEEHQLYGLFLDPICRPLTHLG
jgi:hypothetical protein